MFSRQNNSNSLSVNTRLYASFADDSLLVVSGWNNNISLKFFKAVGTDANGLTQYDQDSSSALNFIIVQENAAALLKGINDKIYPAIENGAEDKIAITTTGSNSVKKILIVGVENGSVYVAGGVNITDNNTVDKENLIYHTFKTREYYDNYDETTGGTKVSIQSDFINFVKKIESIYNFTPDILHGFKYNNAISEYYRPNNSNRFNNSNYRPGIYNGNNSNYNKPHNQENYSASVNTFNGDNMEEFLPFQ